MASVAGMKLPFVPGPSDLVHAVGGLRQAVAEALADPAGVREVFATEAAAAAHRDLLAAAPVPVRLVTEKAAASLSETVTPQGLVAVCALRDVPADVLVEQPPSLTVALAELADYLAGQGIERVVLESTSDYWRPFLYILSARGLPQVWLVNAAQMKNVPGRPKTDKLDAVWLAKLAERSMITETSPWKLRRLCG